MCTIYYRGPAFALALTIKVETIKSKDSDVLDSNLYQLKLLHLLCVGVSVSPTYYISVVLLT